jgi:hypothetical protein
MKLRLLRRWLTPRSTIGELFLDDAWECFTLEDPVREGPKVPGETAIPAGVYPVIVTTSPRAQGGGLWSPSPDFLLPMLLNVPGFTGVRIHAGNRAKDTEGCILVGRTRGEDMIGESRPALSVLLPKLLAAPGEITLEVTEA